MKRRRRIVFFTFGKGSGDLVVGISLALAFKRAGCDVDFTAVTNNEFESIADGFCEHIAVPIEPHLFMVADRRTRLYKALRRLKPDLLIVYGSWVPVLPFLDEISGQKILLLRQVNDPFLRIEIPGRDPIPINAADYDLALSCEPCFVPAGFDMINPIVIRNRDEIMTREDARRELGVPDGKKLAVIARNGYDGELEELLARRELRTQVQPTRAAPEIGGAPETRRGDALLGRQPTAAPVPCGRSTLAPDLHSPAVSEWHELVTTNKDGAGIFPLADYAAAIDLLVSGGGYSTFYECRYFGIPCELSAFPRNAENIEWRLQTNADITFDVNGADEFVGAAMSI